MKLNLGRKTQGPPATVDGLAVRALATMTAFFINRGELELALAALGSLLAHAGEPSAGSRIVDHSRKVHPRSAAMRALLAELAPAADREYAVMVEQYRETVVVRGEGQ